MYLEAMDKILDAARENAEEHADRRREVLDLQLSIRVALSIMSDDQIVRLLEALSGSRFESIEKVQLFGGAERAENVRIFAERRRRALARPSRPRRLPLR